MADLREGKRELGGSSLPAPIPLERARRLPRSPKGDLAMTGLSELSLRGVLPYCHCEAQSAEAIWSFSPVIPAEAGIQKVGEVRRTMDFLPKPSVRRPFCIGVKVMRTRKLYCAD